MHYYINLASPFFFEDDSIKYIDFDFDLKIYPNKPFQIVDHDDFLKNKEKLYSKEIVDVIYENIITIAMKYQTRENIFDESYVYGLFESLIILKEINLKELFDEE